ncbi:GMC family oxidoreductase N-terminal domain-containing protein [Ferrovibrio sp.]|uniref:GMC family oxidoreductase n=1 Tax=Ferrovibrio sp. TaxID=1917215 RepID=UPI0025BEC885|nr:GMC family oxidoreductase N-terminal domain-containing protein [Ferrovibrio sp.]
MANMQRRADDIEDAGEFDYVIVGGGTAGSLLANRLSADPKNRVLLLEAGGKDDWIWFHIPIGYLFAIGNPRSDWCFKTEPVPGLNGRSIGYARGKVLGGCTAINAMVYMRGQAADYDGWRQLGLTGWGWEDVLPYFLKHEDHWSDGAAPLHKSGGEWRVEQPRVTWDILDAVGRAGAEIGIPPVDDFNRGDNEGAGYFQVNQRKGRRWSAATGFLKPVLNRPNLDVRIQAHAERIELQGKRASAVIYRQNGRRLRVRAAGEILLTAGAIASPQLLQLSGIGPGALLQQHGINVRHEAPGVGENLQDHLQIRLIYKVKNVVTINELDQSLLAKAKIALDYALFRRGALTMAPSQFGMFTRSSPEHATANVEFHIQPLSLDKFGDPLHKFPAFTASICNLRPTSRGHVRITSSDAAQAPAIQPNYLATPEDRRVAVDSLKLTRRLAQAPALAPYQPEEYLPGPQVQSEEQMFKAAGDLGATIFHPVGTAKMGPEHDAMAVLDGDLRVRGIQALRVVDASAMPLITSGNTASPTLMIAEKAAESILRDARGR